jgi:hypothetical protein
MLRRLRRSPLAACLLVGAIYYGGLVYAFLRG